MPERDNREAVRGGVERARRAAARGFSDVRDSLVHGVGELSDLVGKAAKSRRKGAGRPSGRDGGQSPQEEVHQATADPAGYFDAASQKAAEELGLANILISGQTGVGKSTLINAVLRIPVAEEGTGKPVTQHVQRYRKEGVPVTIFDTPGIELGDAKTDIIREYKKTIAESRSGKPEDLIHVAWYCVDAGQSRVQDYDLEIVRALADELEVILVLTQCVDDVRAGELESVLAAEKLPVRGEPIRTLAKPRTLMDRTLPARGLEELVARTNDILPEAVRRAFANAQGVVISLKATEARKVIAASTTAAAAVGATPIPVPDAVLLLPLQLGMLARISVVFGIDVSRDHIGELIKGLVGGGGSTLVGRQLAETLLKYIPGGVAINATVAAAITAALGEAYVRLCTELLRRRADGQPMPEVEMLPFLLDAYRTVFATKNPLRMAPARRRRDAD